MSCTPDHYPLGTLFLKISLGWNQLTSQTCDKLTSHKFLKWASMNKVAQDWVSDEVTRSNCFPWMDLNYIINSYGKKVIDIIMLCQEWHENYITHCLIGQYCYDATSRIFDQWNSIFDQWNSHQTGMKSPFQWHNHLLGKKTKGLLDNLLASVVVMWVSCAIYWKKNLLHLGKLII